MRHLRLFLIGFAYANSAAFAQDADPEIPAQDFTGQTAYKVLGVTAGDRVTLDIDGKLVGVSLLGVDAPEKRRPYSREATSFLKTLLKDKAVFMEAGTFFGPKVPGRRAVYLFRAPDGLFVNLEVLRQGYGRAHRGHHKFSALFERHENEARKSDKGVWGPAGLGADVVPKKNAALWGQIVLATRVVYVIDFSGSITGAVGDLKRELKRSIGDLKPPQSFNVIIFYSTGTSRSHRFRTESYANGLRTANKTSKAAFFKWIDRKSPMGQTEPLPALRRALKQNAEAILFLSDGLFDDSVVTEVTRLNRTGRTKIYCFLFDEVALTETGNLPPRDTPGTPRLRKMAEQNGNTRLKIVTGYDLK